METLERYLLYCDGHPEDFESWFEFLRCLQRKDLKGPLVDFVRRQVNSLGCQKKKEEQKSFAQEVWKPLISQGFVLFSCSFHYRSGKVLHVGKSIGSHLEGCCGYLSSLQHENESLIPYIGHELAPCKKCLQRLRTLSGWWWSEGEKLTKVQLKALWSLRENYR